ncbi:phospholipase D-like domain-containing protein [Silvimonas amylolytica]|uniref:phospholipase D n=1 Tax=Silvimonas amylolytica TaxID=449663 RepID=A0ABQ2PI73_9NEIS|nr:phospholipase D-like domain-containing protein [Silvimonas amylolytica]GGP25076.1 hypothetical protein GCM10010971_08950 [Silvimonas amylolytica]
MRAVAFCNNDIVWLAWRYDQKIPGCLGFAIYRIDVATGQQTPLPAMATFNGQDATKDRTTLDDPVQKFSWKDVYATAAGRGKAWQYKIVPMGGQPGALQPLPDAHFPALTTNTVTLSADYGQVSVYFNRGILATQSTADKLGATADTAPSLVALTKALYTIDDPLRNDLAGQMIEALTVLPDAAQQGNRSLYCAFYEFDDPQVIGELKKLGSKLHLVLSNMPDKDSNDTYAPQRQEIKDAGAQVRDRFMKSNHIGHNKFQVLLEDTTPTHALFGSTNVTAHGLCAQTNNTVIIHHPDVARAYKNYWDQLYGDTLTEGTVTAQQAPALRQWCQQQGSASHGQPIGLDKGSLEVWFSPNTPHARASSPGPDEVRPPDLDIVFKLISEATQAVLFLVFEPGYPSIVDAVGAALKANPALFVRGAVTDPYAAAQFKQDVTGDGQKVVRLKNSDTPPDEDFRVIHTRGVNKADKFGQWAQELNQAGHAVVHDKIVVIDPFSDNCVVITGSHNCGYKASYDNDENLNIIRGHREAAQAFAVHCLDVYDHYSWRYWLEKDPANAWHFLAANADWQDNYVSADKIKSAELKFWLGEQ